MKEATVKDFVRAWLCAVNAWWFMPSQTGIGQRGVPDFVGVLPGGRIFAIECKGSGGLASTAQLEALKEIRGRGGFSWLVNPSNLEQFEIELGAYVNEDANRGAAASANTADQT